jgi:hypothetical protein
MAEIIVDVAVVLEEKKDVLQTVVVSLVDGAAILEEEAL